MRNDATTASQPAPFWRRLNTFFAFPFQRQPLLYAVVLAASSLLAAVLPHALIFLAVQLGIALATIRYGFKVTALGSQGLLRASDYPTRLEDDWSAMPWKLFGVYVVFSLFAGLVESVNARLGVVAFALMSFSLPANTIVLVLTGSFAQAINPAQLWDTMRVVGLRPYFLLCFFIFMLINGMGMGITFALPALGSVVALPLFNFIVIYFSWVTFSLLGYVIYQNHEAFGIDLLADGEADDDQPELTPEQQAQHAADAHVAQLIGDGNLPAAVATAYEAQRIAPQSLPAQRRYHRVLLLSDKTSSLLDHGQRFIDLLVQRSLTAEALKAYQDCKAKDAGFALQSPVSTLALARSTWQRGDARGTAALLSGFDKRFAHDATLPDFYELAARLLAQGLSQPDKALRILRLLQTRYPDAPQTQEVQWLLRGARATPPVSTSERRQTTATGSAGHPAPSP
ncbi:MAG TPA: hypothetical protein VGC24_08065 [Burkholderiaceae bacterium]